MFIYKEKGPQYLILSRASLKFERSEMELVPEGKRLSELKKLMGKWGPEKQVTSEVVEFFKKYAPKFETAMINALLKISEAS